MKKLLQTTGCVLFLATAAHAQLVVPAGGYAINPIPDTLRGADFTLTATALPSTGTNQIWDYSAVTGTSYNAIWDIPDNNPNYPNASAILNYSPSLGPLTLMGSRQYYLNDVDGVYIMGFESAANTYPIAAGTGGAADVLAILNTHNAYGKNYPMVKFPMAYQGAWSSQVVGVTAFNLTVAGFGLTAAPGEVKQHINRKDTVVGWGSLTIGGNGMANAPALLVRSTYTQVDSVLLGGAPAPPALMTGFGLTQGATTTTVDFRFYVYDGQTRLLPAMVLFQNAAGTAVTGGYYDRANYSNISTNDLPNRLAASVYPNPAANNRLDIALGAPVKEPLQLTVVAMTGQKTGQFTLQPGTSNFEISLAGWAEGYYFLNITNSAGELVFTDKFLKL